MFCSSLHKSNLNKIHGRSLENKSSRMPVFCNVGLMHCIGIRFAAKQKMFAAVTGFKGFFINVSVSKTLLPTIAGLLTTHLLI